MRGERREEVLEGEKKTKKTQGLIGLVSIANLFPFCPKLVPFFLKTCSLVER